MTEQESASAIWVTASDVKSFSVCPWIVYQQKVLGHFLNVTTLGMAKGSFEHEARRRLVDRLNECKRMDPETVEKVVEQSFPYARIQNEEFSFSLRREKESLMRRLKDEIGELVTMPPAQTEVRLLSPERGLVGRIDCLFKVEGKYIPCDYKTGYPGALHDSNVLQVATYALLLEDNGMPVAYGMVYYTKSQERIQFPITNELKDKVMSIVGNIRLMLMGQWEPSQDPLRVEWCRTCHYKTFCEDYLRTKKPNEANDA